MRITFKNKGRTIQVFRDVCFAFLVFFLLFILVFWEQSDANQCPRGFQLVDGKCVPVVIPPNAELNVYGNGWKCKRGFQLVDGKCVPVVIPPNAELNVYGNDWVCRPGFKKTANQCIPMTPEEQKQQQEQMRKIIEQIKRRRVAVNDRCDAAYNRCVNECESVSIFNYETGNYRSVRNTDFLDNCEEACSRGRRYCEDEDDNEEKCYEFKRACRNDCPSDVYDYRSGKYLMLTDANDQCEDACGAGERECESW